MPFKSTVTLHQHTKDRLPGCIRDKQQRDIATARITTTAAIKYHRHTGFHGLRQTDVLQIGKTMFHRFSALAVEFILTVRELIAVVWIPPQITILMKQEQSTSLRSVGFCGIEQNQQHTLISTFQILHKGILKKSYGIAEIRVILDQESNRRHGERIFDTLGNLIVR